MKLKLADDFTADEVRHREAVGSTGAFGFQTAGYYHKFTEAQEAALTALLRWLRQHRPEVFKLENVLGQVKAPLKTMGRTEEKVIGSLSFRHYEEIPLPVIDEYRFIDLTRYLMRYSNLRAPWKKSATDEDN